MRRRTLWGASGAVLLSGVTGTGAWFAAQPRTAEQQAAIAAPPEPSDITVAVRRGRLADQVALPGAVTRSSIVPVITPALPGIQRTIVTRRPLAVGHEVRSGEVVAEVSGRPVIVLPGQFPAYRSLGPGSEGPDVRQLRAALRDLVGTPSGAVFDRRLERDLESLYRRAGYRPVRAKGAIQIPLGELAFVASTPAAVTAAGPAVGDTASDTLLTLSCGALVVAATLPPDRTGDVDPAARLSFGAGPWQGRPARLERIRTIPGANGAKPTREALFVPAVHERGRPRPGTGQEVLITRAQTASDALIVPLSALWTRADGGVSVTVLQGGGKRNVDVVPGVAVRGESAVSGELNEGDLVVVGSR